MTDGRAVRWRVPNLADCHWASWEPGEYFLFNPASGKTHLLNETGRTLLLLLGEQPCSSQELGERLHGADTGMSIAQLQVHIAEQLRQLALVGLVESAP